MPQFCNFVFKNDSPLGFMIALCIKNRVPWGLKVGSTPKKTKFTREKTKFTYDLLIFMTFLSPILENELTFGMIRFRKFF